MQDTKNDSFEEIRKQPENIEVNQQSGEESAAQEVIDEEKESQYQKAVSFMGSIACMTACKDKVKLYKSVAMQFAAISGYKDSDILMKKCKRKAKKVKEAIKMNVYERAQYHMSRAKTSTDYIQAASEFRKVKGYLDADDLAVKCDQLGNNIQKRGVQRIFLKWGILVICAVLLILGITTPFAKYTLADFARITGSYHFAADIYGKLGSYKDSMEKQKESLYHYGLKLQAAGDYVDANIVFLNLDDYKNSADIEVELEKQVIRNSEIGDTVFIGNVKWVILDVKENQALLLEKKSLPGIAYHDLLQDVTWETSQLRNYLNSGYLSATFTKQEQKNIVLSNVINNDNATYGTDGGADTKDYLFILSAEEAQKYINVLPKMKIDTWLRTPGASGQSASFLLADGSVMDYGYDVSSTKLSLRPAMWFYFEDTK